MSVRFEMCINKKKIFILSTNTSVQEYVEIAGIFVCSEYITLPVAYSYF